MFCVLGVSVEGNSTKIISTTIICKFNVFVANLKQKIFVFLRNPTENKSKFSSTFHHFSNGYAYYVLIH